MPKPKPVAESKLAANEDRFVAEYFAAGCNGTVAYMRTFGCGPTSARSNAARMMRRDSVKAKIAATHRRLQRDGPVKPEVLIREIAKAAFADIGDIYDFSKTGPPQLRPGRDIPPDARQAIQGIETTVLGGKKARVKSKVMLAKLRAQDMLCRILGLYKEPELDALLGHLFASLPPESADEFRRLLAGKVRPGTVVVLPESAGAGAGAPAEAAGGGPADPGAGVPVGRADPGPVAAEVPGRRAQPADGAGLPPGGEDGGLGGQDPAPLFDDP